MRPTTRRWIYLALAIAMGAGAATRINPINQQRVENELIVDQISDVAKWDNAVPLLMAIGRAPVIDYLWLRATKLKEDGRFFDALQLSQLICKLQPRFPAVWAFNAWNMSYNIAVTTDAPEERWRWVMNGIKLLRDQGIPANPHNAQLYRELAWIYLHKIGDLMDEQHWYYKNQFALLMEDVLGPGDNCDWNALAAAPENWDDLLKLTWSPDASRDGTSQREQESVAEFIKECKSYKTDVTEPGVLLGLLDDRAVLERKGTAINEPAPVWEVLNNPAFQWARKQVEYYWRAKRVRTELKLDPKRIVTVREKYGPLDFRTAEAHALYWAEMGVEQGIDIGLRLDINKLNADRIVIYALQGLARRGRIFVSPEAESASLPPMVMPDVRFIQRTFDAIIERSKPYLKNERNEGPVSLNFESAFLNYARDGIVAYYEAGDMEAAKNMFDWLRDHYDHPNFERGLEAFVQGHVLGQSQVLTTHFASQAVAGYVQRALLLFGYGQQTEGLNYLGLARRTYDRYHSDLPPGERSRLLPFEQIVKYTFDRLNESPLPADFKSRVATQLGFTAEPASQPSVSPDLVGPTLPTP